MAELAEVQSMMDSGDPERAAGFLRQVAGEPNATADVYDQLAEVEMSLGETEAAANAWMRAIELSGDPNDPGQAERWLYLAQLQEGDPARTSYLQGISLLQARRSGVVGSGSVTPASSSASSSSSSSSFSSSSSSSRSNPGSLSTSSAVAAAAKDIGSGEGSREGLGAGDGGGRGGGRGDAGEFGADAPYEDSDEMDDSTIQAQLCTAYCALAELYLTDLCFEEDAEQSCQTALDQSMHFNTTNSHEPVQGLASLRLSQGLYTEASQLMHVAYERIIAVQESDAPVDTELRLAAVRLLMEGVPHAPACADDALGLLSTLMREDDENVEIWFLMGVAFFQQTPPDLELSRQYLEKAGEMLDAVKKAMQQDGEMEHFPYDEQVRLVKSQLEEIATAEKERTAVGAEAASQGADEEGAEEDADEDWEDEETFQMED